MAVRPASSPVFVERQQSLTDGRISRPGGRSVVEQVEVRVISPFACCAWHSTSICPTSGVMRLDGIRHVEETHRWQARVRKPCVNALTDRPDPVFARQCGERLHRKIGHQVVELSHQPLIGAEHNRVEERRLVVLPSVAAPPAHFPASIRSSPIPRSDNNRPARAPRAHIARCSTQP